MLAATDQVPEQTAPTARRRSPLLRGLHALEILAERPATIADMAEALGVSRSSAHRLVSKLEAGGYVRRAASGRYFELAERRFPTPHADGEGQKTPRDVQAAADWSVNLVHQTVGRWGETIQEIVLQLRDTTAESAMFAVATRDEMLYVAFAPSAHPVRVEERIGATRPMHCSAVGKAYLARLDTATLDIVLGRLTYTEGTVAAARGPFQLRDMLAAVYEQGYAVDRGETAHGLSCVATSVVVNNVLVGAVGVTGPSERFSDECIRSYGKLLLQKAQQLAEA